MLKEARLTLFLGLCALQGCAGTIRDDCMFSPGADPVERPATFTVLASRSLATEYLWGMSIEATASDGTKILSVETDSVGTARFQLPPGNLTLTFRSAGYYQKSLSLKVEAGMQCRVNVRLVRKESEWIRM
jgi:hypothetical protein